MPLPHAPHHMVSMSLTAYQENLDYAFECGRKQAVANSVPEFVKAVRDVVESLPKFADPAREKLEQLLQEHVGD